MELKHYIGYCAAFFLVFLGVLVYANPYILEPSQISYLVLFTGTIALYSSVIGIFSTYFWSKGLRYGLAASILMAYFYAVAENPEIIYYGMGKSLQVIALAFSLLSVNIVVSSLEYLYKNQKKAKALINNKNILYSSYIGWLHAVFGFCLAILTYETKHIIKYFFSLRFLTGFTGTFLLGAIPAYHYFKEGKRLPAVLTGAWITWGIVGFTKKLEMLPVNKNFPAPEFTIPPAPGYLFSSYLMLSIIILYTAVRRTGFKDRVMERF